jgi:ketosteroid isomerase-like protein
MRTAKELALALVDGFGDPNAVTALLADDVEWWISPTVEVFPHHMVGRDAVAETMRLVFGQIYADVRVTVHGAIGDGDQAAVRITMRARALGSVDYENEYALFVKARDGLVTRVWEYVDMQHAMNQLAPAADPAGPAVSPG